MLLVISSDFWTNIYYILDQLNPCLGGSMHRQSQLLLERRYGRYELLSQMVDDSLVVSVLDLESQGPCFEPVGRGWSRSKRGPVALCTLGLGLLNPPSLNGQ